MMNQNSEDWLPPGWTVKVKVRKSGKKDKYYFEPSSQMRFNSRAEVSRYLKTAAIYHPEPEESRTEQSGNHVEVKEAIAEELPPGWIREIRVTKTANRIRRDSFYIDPVNGNALRSIRDVHRYLTTGKVRRLAYKSRNQRNSDLEFQQHDDISVSALKSPALSKKEMLTIGKARRQIVWSQNSSEPSEITNDEAIFQNAMGVRESMRLSEPNSGHGGIGTKLHNSTLAEAKDTEQSEGKNDFSEFVSTPDESIPHELAIENEPTKIESKKRQRKGKDMNLPRRASKRLAGLQADPVLEVKAGRRARPVASEESDRQVSSASQCSENPDVKHETKSVIDRPKSIDTSLDSSRKEHFRVDSPILPKHVKMKSEDAYEDKADVKQGPLLKLPVEDLLTDPCIAFAVKTLTGGAFDASISSEVSLSRIDSAPNEKTTVEPESKLVKKLPSPELPVGNIVEKKLESTLELPVGEILADPCIEFAIKTLTGEIPLDNNPEIEDYFHQLGSSKAQGTSANASNRVGSEHYYETNVLSQKQQPILALAASPNINFQSCGTGLLQQERDRNNEFQRH